MNNGIPFEYDYLNVVNSQISPSTIHAHNTQLSAYYRRYLMQKAIAMFKFTGVPESWALNYMQYCLFELGRFCIFDSGLENFGVIPQWCTFSKRDVFYRPANVIVTNPLLKPKPDRELKLGVDAALIYLQPNYNGLYDMVSYYADLMAVTAEAAGINILNSKYAWVFRAQNKAAAESFKKMYDSIEAGNPAVVIDKQLLNDDGNPTWMAFTNNLTANYIAPELLEDLRKIEQRFMTQIGIPNRNTDKRERLITDEVNRNNVETHVLSELWLETVRKGLDEANRLFGLNLGIEYAFKPEFKEEEELSYE